MPEGPEVWLLSKAINQYFNREEKTISYGKHLFLVEQKNNMSFGLTGRVNLSSEDDIMKVNSGWIHGDINNYEDLDTEKNKLGIDFMTSDSSHITEAINKWKKSKKTLASLMLDQSLISGIGVAWGSEILHIANLMPNIKACDQDLSGLADSMIQIREYVINKYEKDLKDNEHKLKDYINMWFENLYQIRNMNVYKKGTQIKVSSRTWWI